MAASVHNRRGKKAFEKRMVAVISIVNPMLIKIAFTFRFVLPGISPGVFKTAPITTAGAYSKNPKK